MRTTALTGSLLLGLALGAGCGGAAPAPEAPRAERAPDSARASGSGIDESAMDPRMDACDDFYRHACGGWLDATPIPADEASWYRSFSVLREQNEETLRGILEGLARHEREVETAYGRALGDFYASCMDEAAIEKSGDAPLAPWLRALDAVKTSSELTRLLGELHAHGAPVVFDLSAGQDFRDASIVVGMLWQAGLGMPEKEYYLDRGPKMRGLRLQYEAHVAAMLGLSGLTEEEAARGAKKVLVLETELAYAWTSKEDRGEPKQLAHRASRAELVNVAPGIDWTSWLAGAGATDVSMFNVGMPGYMRTLGAMLGGKVPLADWKIYLRWHLYRLTADALPQRFVDEGLAWRRALVGATELPPRWKRCVRAVDRAMGEALARPFVERTLGADGKADVVAMVEAIERAMQLRLRRLAWMDEPTREAAMKKLGRVANKIGHPDAWRSYDGLVIDRGPYVTNVLRGAAFEHERQLGKIGAPVDRGEWQMSPPSVSAYYDAQQNEMVFPAGILQAPFYARSQGRAASFGGIGMVMGHELTHGFDDVGRQFDADGNLRDWWPAEVFAAFDRRASCVRAQFDGYRVLSGTPVNGTLTLGENLADLGGLGLAYRAMRATRADGGAAAAGARRFTPEQEFFLGYAQSWCAKLRDEALGHMVATNPHAPPNLRVNGALSNMPEFAAAFACKPDAKMVKKDRCEVW